MRDNDTLGDLLSGVVASGANSVSEVRFVVDDESDARDAAREKAIADAKKKASSVHRQSKEQKQVCADSYIYSQRLELPLF